MEPGGSIKLFVIFLGLFLISFYAGGFFYC